MLCIWTVYLLMISADILPGQADLKSSCCSIDSTCSGSWYVAVALIFWDKFMVGCSTAADNISAAIPHACTHLGLHAAYLDVKAGTKITLAILKVHCRQLDIHQTALCYCGVHATKEVLEPDCTHGFGALYFIVSSVICQ